MPQDKTGEGEGGGIYQGQAMHDMLELAPSCMLQIIS